MAAESTALGPALRLTWLDRLAISIAPGWGMRRVRARASVDLLARNYEAAAHSRRTSGWHRLGGDANATSVPALRTLRALSRDLLRNDGWPRNGVRTIINNVVGWGIVPKADDRSRARGKRALEVWRSWAESTACDFDGRLDFVGLQGLVMRTVVESGEALILAQPASSKDGLAVPLRIQVLEPDYLDTHKTVALDGGNRVRHGIEVDGMGRRVAYWLFNSHPGDSTGRGLTSVRVPAERVIHVYDVERAGQIRGVPWLAAAIAKIQDLGDFEDAELMQAKVAACFGAFVSDVDGSAAPLGEVSTGADGAQLDHLEPGHIEYLPPGRTVTFAQPPRGQESGFAQRSLRKIAAALGVTYEDLTGDYSQVNFSSARIARLAHWASVERWRWHMLIPSLCDGVWRWVMDLAAGMEGWQVVPRAQWAAPPMPILEPDKEGLAYSRLVRGGFRTWPQVVRELGADPIEQMDEIARANIDLDARGIILDCDPRHTNASGGGQQVSADPATEAPPTEAPPAGS